jgi:hypothetical protein
MKLQRIIPLLAVIASPVFADPLLTTWHTKDAGKYARIWRTIEEETTEKTTGTTTSVTTWNRVLYPVNDAGVRAGDQTTAVYGGVQEISYSTNYVYVRATGLGTHTMGPWYDNNAARNTLFASWPGNAKLLWRFPRTVAMRSNASYVSAKTATNIGTCGLFANGVPLFNTSDTFSYSNASAKDAGPGSGVTGSGDGVWNRDAYTNEGPTFDSGGSHQAMESHHYHGNPPALRYLLGDSVAYNPNVVFNNHPDVKTSPYTESFNGKHSPIIGWVKDGLPMYGPYGYSDPTDTSSTVRRMISGYQKRDGTNGSVNLAVTGRTTRPQWSITLAGKTTTTLTSGQYGPAVSSTFVLGRYMEDYDYKGNLTGLRRYQGVSVHGAHNSSTDYDLNEYNVRFCKTPEFPNGTWAYFTCVAADGTPVYPYNLSWSYFGDPTISSAVTSITETVTSHFAGATALANDNKTIDYNIGTSNVTLVWDAIEGGTYSVDTSTNLTNWTQAAITGTATTNSLSTVDSAAIPANTQRKFYRLTRTALAPYESVTGVVVSAGNVSHTFTFTGNLPPDTTPITGVTVGGVTGSVTTYTKTGTGATIAVTFDKTTLTVGQSYTAVLSVTGPPPTMTALTFTSTNTYTR